MAAEPLIDCDVHAVVPKVEALFPYLAEHWRKYIETSSFKGPVESSYPANAPTTARPGSRPEGGGPAGSSLALLREQALDPLGAELAILNCTYGVESVHNPDAAAALATAANEWLVEEWLDREPRLRGSIVVPSRQPADAAREIDRAARDRRFVQVLLPARSEAPYGDRRYLPIWEAATRNGLAVGIHFGGAPGNPPTPSGWTTYYLEEYSGMAQVFQSQLISIVSEGVCDRFPELRIALLEAGWAWLPPLMWRFDKDWKGLRREIPWVRRAPSEYIRQHVRFALQPVDAPSTAAMLETIEEMGSDELVMFSSDHPHWHFDALDEALPPGLPEPLRRGILSEHARAFYGLKVEG